MRTLGGRHQNISILISKLKGKVLKPYNEGIGLIGDISYDEIKRHLISMYKVKESKAEKIERFFRICQRGDEGVEAFYFRLRGLSSNLGYSPVLINEIMKERFIDGLRPDIANHVILSHTQNIEEAMDRAKEIEMIEMWMGKREKRVGNICEDEVGSVMEWCELCKQINSMRREVNHISMRIEGSEKKIKPNPKVINCTACGGENHVATRCEYLQNLN